MYEALATEQVEEILAGCEGASPGPWTVFHDMCAQCAKNGTAEYGINGIPGGYHAPFSVIRKSLTSPASGERDAPSGYVLVPLEPTEGMLAAGMDSLAESTGEPLSFIVRDVLFAYRAMLAKGDAP